MPERNLNVVRRKQFGSAVSRRERKAGMIPAVVYGHQATKHFLINRREFMNRFKYISESEIIALKSDDETLQVLIKDHQDDLIRGELIHLDFYEIEQDKKLKTHLQIYLMGTPVGVREGGILEVPIHELEIECLPKDLPERIEVDISNLQDSTALHVRDITPPHGLKILTHDDQVIAAVTHVKAETLTDTEVADDETTVQAD